MYKTDATFNTNCLKLLLSVMVKTFLTAYSYITLELAASFKFVANQLSNLVFYNYPKSAVIVRDFSKGLGAAVELGLTNIIDEALIHPLERDEELLEVVEVIVTKANRRPQLLLLQLCE
jgi:hypothetical protein